MNWKQIFSIITLCILFIVIIFIIAKKVFRGFKQYQKMDKELKDKINILILIFFSLHSYFTLIITIFFLSYFHNI